MSSRKNNGRSGFITAVSLLVLVIVSTLMVSLGSVGIMNLHDQQSYRDSSLAQYAAAAAVGEALADIAKTKNFGTTPVAVSVNQSNNVTGSANFATPPCSPCPQNFSINNLSGSSTVNDGFGYPVPVGYVKINGTATSNGKTVVSSVVAAPFPYAILADGTISATTVTGAVRNDVTSGTPDITVTSATMAMTPDTAAGAIVGTVSYAQTGASPITIPDIPVSQIVASESTAGCSACVTPHADGGPADKQFPDQASFIAWQNSAPRSGVLDASVGSCSCSGGIYIGGDVTLSGSQSITIQNGVKLFINGNFKQNGGPHFYSSGSPDNLLMVTGTFTMNGANLSNLQLVTGGNIQFNGDSHISGFVYSENGNVTTTGTGSVWSGDVVSRTGTASIYSMTYDSSALDGFMDFYSIPLTVLTSWNQ